MNAIRCAGILMFAGAVLATAGCGRTVLADPPADAAVAVNHNPSAYAYAPGAGLAKLPWIALNPRGGGEGVELQGAVLRYSTLLRGAGAGVGDALSDHYDVFYASAWFGELQGDNSYWLRAGEASKPVSRYISRFSTLPSELRRGALKAATPLDQKTVAEAKLAIPEALNEALGGLDLSAYTRPLFPAFYADGQVTHGVKIETLRFTSVSPSGQPIEASALLAYPDDLSSQQTPPPLVSYQHYTDGGDKSTSDASDVRAIAMAYAARGAVFVAADTVGIGASKGEPLSYLLWANAANTYYDGILAANNRLAAEKRIGRPLSRLHLVGYSKGGFGTLALAETLESLYGTPAEKVYFGAAPLDMPRTFDAYLKQRGQRDVGGNKFAENLDAEVLESYIKEAILPSWGAVLPREIGVAKLYDAAGQLDAGFADRYLAGTDDSNIGLKSFMEANSFTERTTFLSRFPLTQSKVRAFHYAKDPVIPAENTEAFMRLAAAKGVPDVQRGDCREATRQFVVLQRLTLFLSASDRANTLHALCGFSMLDASLGDL